MIPYVGCKQSFAKELLANIPEAENFYDLFGGGGSITEAASGCQDIGIFGKWQKWKHIHYNEINKVAFYEWAATHDFPIYFSEYSCNDKRFELVWEKNVIAKINRGNGIYRTEKLFWNKITNKENI